MQEVLNLQKEAKLAFAKADHLVYMTYPTIKEVRLLYSAIESINTALLKSLDALLLYERVYKQIGVFPKDLNSKLNIYMDYCVRKHGFDQEIGFLIRALNKIIEAKRNAPIEFARQGKFVICSDDYRMRIIDDKMVKKHLSMARPFIAKVGEHINVGRR
ncbi:MAG: hypothetical protein ABIJ18_03745 [archaeon]